MKKIRVCIWILLSCGLLSVAGGCAFLLMSGSTEAPKKVSADYLAEGDSYSADGAYEKALISYQKVLEEEEHNVTALKGIAETYGALEYYEEEEETRNLLLKVDNDDLENQVELVNVMLKLNKLDEARSMAEELLADGENENLQMLYQEMNVKEPLFTLEEGSYDSYQLLELEETPENASVYYTTDGSEPTKESELYMDGIVISYPDTVIKAKAIGYLGYESNTVEMHFTITKPIENVAKSNYSNIMSDIRYNYLHKEWEDPIYNYELAQIRSLYVLGNGYISTELLTNTGFYEDSYEVYNSRRSEKGEGKIEEIRYMPFLKVLSIGYQKELSLEPLVNLQYLEELSLLNNGITDISVLGNLKNLKKLALGWNQIQDVSALGQLTELVSLGLWDNNIQNIDSLNNLNKLLYFDISGNEVADISVAGNMKELTEVWINNNQITSLAPLNNCENLRILMLCNNPIFDYGIWKDEAGRLERTDM